MVSTAALHARVRGSVPGLGGLKETKMFLPHTRVKFSIVGSLRDRDVASSASDCQGSHFEACVWRTVSFHSSHHSQEVLLAQLGGSPRVVVSTAASHARVRGSVPRLEFGVRFPVSAI